MTHDLGPDEQALTPEEIALEDAENDAVPQDDDWPRARPYQEDGHLAVPTDEP